MTTRAGIAAEVWHFAAFDSVEYEYSIGNPDSLQKVLTAGRIIVYIDSNAGVYNGVFGKDNCSKLVYIVDSNNCIARAGGSL